MPTVLSWSSVGQFVGDVAPIAALPFGAAATVASRVPMLAKTLTARGALPLAARTADAAATQAGIGAALAPEDRGSAAAWGATGGAVGQALGRIASGIVKPTAEAQKLISEGVALTPGQAAGKGSAVGTIEEWAASRECGKSRATDGMEESL